MNSNQSPLMGGGQKILQYLCHLPTCGINQNWDEARQALMDTPFKFRNADWYSALEELSDMEQRCTCGLDDFIKYELPKEDNVASPSNSGDASVVSLACTSGNSVEQLRTKIIETTSRTVKDHDADEVRGMTEVPMRFINELDELLSQLDTAETTAPKTHPHE